MAHCTFQTLGPATLIRDGNVVSLDDPLLTAFLAVLAVAGAAGVPETELQLLLTPDAKRDAARRELSRLVARVRELLGAASIEVRADQRHVLAPKAVSLDVDVLATESDTTCNEFLRDLRVPDAPEFDEWLSAARRRVRPRADAATRSVAVRGNTIRRGAALAGVVAVLSVAAYLVERRSVGFATGDAILVADVANRTGDTLFDQGMLTAASVALQQSGRARLYSRARLPAVYRLMKLPANGTPLDYELAQDVAERDHVRWVLGLSIGRSTDGYRVGARVTDVERHAEIADVSAAASTKGDVIGALDDVLLRVRRTLGESRWALRGRHSPLPLVTTASLEALRSYAEGSAAWSALRFDHAQELWLRAADLDTGFAMAYGSLGDWYYYHHDRAKGEFYYEQAFKRSDRLSEWERLRLLENQATYRGNTDSSLVLSQMIAERFPSVTSWYNYGTDLMRAGRRAEAKASLHRALSFD